jgi:hypothetical protein
MTDMDFGDLVPPVCRAGRKGLRDKIGRGLYMTCPILLRDATVAGLGFHVGFTDRKPDNVARWLVRL